MCFCWYLMKGTAESFKFNGNEIINWNYFMFKACYDSYIFLRTLYIIHTIYYRRWFDISVYSDVSQRDSFHYHEILFLHGSLWDLSVLYAERDCCLCISTSNNLLVVIPGSALLAIYRYRNLNLDYIT